jgi:hypothetical protein
MASSPCNRFGSVLDMLGMIARIHGESFILASIKRISMGILARYVLVALIVRIPVHGTFDIL